MSERLADTVADTLALEFLRVLESKGHKIHVDAPTMRTWMQEASTRIPELAGIGAMNPTGDAVLVLNEEDGKHYMAVLVEEYKGAVL